MRYGVVLGASRGIPNTRIAKWLRHQSRTYWVSVKGQRFQATLPGSTNEVLILLLHAESFSPLALTTRSWPSQKYGGLTMRLAVLPDSCTNTILSLLYRFSQRAG